MCCSYTNFKRREVNRVKRITIASREVKIITERTGLNETRNWSYTRSKNSIYGFLICRKYYSSTWLIIWDLPSEQRPFTSWYPGQQNLITCGIFSTTVALLISVTFLLRNDKTSNISHKWFIILYLKDDEIFVFWTGFTFRNLYKKTITLSFQNTKCNKSQLWHAKSSTNDIYTNKYVIYSKRHTLFWLVGSCRTVRLKNWE